IDPTPDQRETWIAFATLTPELFPLLHHAQFEDTLARSFADPITGIVKAVTPDDDTRCQLSIRIESAGERQSRRAERAVRTLDYAFCTGSAKSGIRRGRR